MTNNQDSNNRRINLGNQGNYNENIEGDYAQGNINNFNNCIFNYASDQENLNVERRNGNYTSEKKIPKLGNSKKSNFLEEKDLQELKQTQEQIKKRVASIQLADEDINIYSELSFLLNNENLDNETWEKADRETINIIFNLTDSQDESFSGYKDDFNKISCLDLLKIDLLWLKASNNRFGFSVQRKIWLKKLRVERLEENQFRNVKNLQHFGTTVKWYENNELLKNRDYYNFSLDAPYGHLPSLRFPCSEFAQDNLSWEQSWKRIVKSFLMSTQNCLLD